jgi:hypothetical protein
MVFSRREFMAGALGTVLPPSTLDYTRLIPRALPRSIVFRQPGWDLWDPCMVRTGDGVCHLLFSRWSTGLGFDAWATHAEIAWATARGPEGPYRFQKTVLPSRGAGFWDGHSVYNTCVIRHRDKFYLYYAGNRGPAEWRPDRAPTTRDESWWTQRNNQRIGVAVADHPGGPWIRSDKPLIDVGPDSGHGIVATPCVTPMPDGRFLMVYKTLAPGPGRVGGGVFHYPATASNPLGPFIRHPRPMVDKSRIFKRHFNFHIDDHFEWFQGDRYYAIVKDHDAPFLTPHGRCLYLLESADGLDWRPSKNLLVKDFRIDWDDGSSESFQRLEMPKLFLENGEPRTLFLAALPEGATQSFLVAIPLKSI